MELAKLQVSFLSLLLLLMIGACQGTSQQIAAGNDLAADIDSIVSPYLDAGDFMGVVAVQHDGDAPLIRSYGLASVELDVAHAASDIFLIGSISKQFTATAILLLEEEGKLKTSDEVSKHLPTFKPETPISIEQLLTHTSGIAVVYSLKRYSETNGQGGRFADIIQDLSLMNLTHKPGAAATYSNGGYTVLAAIIEAASGMQYGNYLAERVFEPLGMTSTAHDHQEPVVKNRVPGYDPWGRMDLTAVVPPATAFLTGSGSLWSSAQDLLTWNSALHGNQVLTDSSYAKLTRDYGQAYGYGVSLFKRFGHDVVGHDGRVTGYASDAARYLDVNTTVVLLSNVQSVVRDEIRRAVAAAALGHPATESETRVLADEAADDLLAELEGVYAFGPNFKVFIRVADGRLLARANEGSESELVPTVDGTWFSRVLYATVRFERDETGSVAGLRWGSGDGAPVGTRLR